MEYDELSQRVIGCGIKALRHLGPAQLEWVYELCLTHVRSRHGFPFSKDGKRASIISLSDSFVVRCLGFLRALHVVRGEIRECQQTRGRRVGGMIVANEVVPCSERSASETDHALSPCPFLRLRGCFRLAGRFEPDASQHRLRRILGEPRVLLGFAAKEKPRSFAGDDLLHMTAPFTKAVPHS
jgi:hypothetical protein